ncbi:hypothetical protein D3C81_1587110 [compost metagenome]
MLIRKLPGGAVGQQNNIIPRLYLAGQRPARYGRFPAAVILLAGCVGPADCQGPDLADGIGIMRSRTAAVASLRAVYAQNHNIARTACNGYCPSTGYLSGHLAGRGCSRSSSIMNESSGEACRR